MLLDGTFGNPHGLGDLTLGEAVHLAQGESLAALGWKSGDQGGDPAQFLPRRGLVLGRGVVQRGVEHLQVAERVDANHPSASQVAQDHRLRCLEGVCPGALDMVDRRRVRPARRRSPGRCRRSPAPPPDGGATRRATPARAAARGEPATRICRARGPCCSSGSLAAVPQPPAKLRGPERGGSGGGGGLAGHVRRKSEGPGARPKTGWDRGRAEPRRRTPLSDAACSHA